ncbi:MAG TPA: hypothetical protein EYP85_13555 [Armatimonadetes bacterium]|nr:hypothetical protein [Armatimonadota bacterium]
MKRRRLSWLCLLGLAATGAWAVTLRHQLPVGQTLRYRDEFRGEGELISPLFGNQAVPVQITGEGREEWKILRHLPAEDAYEIEARVLSGKVQYRVNEQVQEVPLPKQDFVMTLTARGKVVRFQTSIPPERSVPPSNLLGLPFDFGRLLNAMRTVGFPEKDLTLGEEWGEEAPLVLPDGTILTARVRSHLTELGERRGEPCAKVVTTFEMPVTFKGELGGMGPVDFKGKIAGTMTTYFAYPRGVVVEASGPLTVNLRILMPFEVADAQGNPVAVDSALRLRIEVKTVLEEET